jgi:hypothetical protein
MLGKRERKPTPVFEPTEEPQVNKAWYRHRSSLDKKGAAAEKPRKRGRKVESVEGLKASRTRTKKREQQGLLMPFALLKVRVSRLVKAPHERFILRKDPQTLSQAELRIRQVTVGLLPGTLATAGQRTPQGAGRGTLTGPWADVPYRR